MEITNSIVINRPVDEVFAFAGNPVNDESWATVMVDSHLTSPGQVEKGATLVQVLRFLGKRVEAQCEITEYEEGSRLAFTMDAGANKGAHERTFEPIGGATRVTLTTRGDSTGLFKIADPLLKRLGDRQMHADLAILKELLEAPDVTPSDLS